MRFFSSSILFICINISNPYAFAQSELKELNLEQCETADAAACMKLGKLAVKHKNWVRADEAYERACDKGDLEGCRQSAHMAGRQELEGTMKLRLELACERGYKAACNELPKFDDTFSKYKADAIKADPQRAQLAEAKRSAEKAEKARVAQLNKDEQSCKAGKSKACITAGHSFMEKSEASHALELFEKACDLKNDEGCLRAGFVSMDQGNTVYGKRLVTEACEMKNRKACKFLDEQNQNELNAQRDALVEQQAKIERMHEEQLAQRKAEQEAQAEEERQERFSQALQNMANQFAPKKRKGMRCNTSRNPWNNGTSTNCEEYEE